MQKKNDRWENCSLAHLKSMENRADAFEKYISPH